MTTSPRYVSVDDTDKSIQYDGPWRQVNDAQNSLDVGPPFYRPAYYKNTLHSINDTVGNFASFSFNFSGSAFSVYGTIIVNNGTQGSTWDCFLDYLNPATGSGNVVMIPTPSTSRSNFGLCYGHQFPDGNHSLTVRVYPNDLPTFFLDRIDYAPSAPVPSAPPKLYESLRIDSSDAAVVYSGGWSWFNEGNDITTLYGNIHYTTHNGAWFTLDFFGPYISCSGFITNASATFSVDSEPSTFIPLADPSSSFPYGSPFTTGMLFEVSGLDPNKPHKLSILYLGNSTPPLYIRYCTQKNLISSSTTIHRRPTIIGSVIGLVLISLLLNIWQT